MTPERGADDRAQVIAALPPFLCRTCMRTITHETRTEPGYLPREGWYDDARVDARVCFKAIDYRHVPLTERERAYYEAGAAAAAALSDTAALDHDPTSSPEDQA